jgi:predicted alpha/beta superfamily hydrolase
MRAVIPFLTFAIFVACSSEDKISDNHDDEESIVTFTQFSTIVKDTFLLMYNCLKDILRILKILIDTLPFSCWTGNFYFPMMASTFRQYEIAGLLEPTIVVGISYKSFTEMDSLRVRDYFYPAALPSDEINAAGGGNLFYDFLINELLPKIDAQYRTDKNNRALLGHSFGGYFVLYSLLNQLNDKTSYFKKFISASPTLWYNNFYLNQLPQQLDKNSERLGLFISVGQMEDSIWSVNPLKYLTTEIRKRNLKGLQFKSRIYNHLDHMDVAVLSFTKGLQELVSDNRK